MSHRKLRENKQQLICWPDILATVTVIRGKILPLFSPLCLPLMHVQSSGKKRNNPLGGECHVRRRPHVRWSSRPNTEIRSFFTFPLFLCAAASSSSSRAPAAVSSVFSSSTVEKFLSEQCPLPALFQLDSRVLRQHF